MKFLTIVAALLCVASSAFAENTSQPPKSWVAVDSRETLLEQGFCKEDNKGVLVRLTDGTLACIQLQVWEGMNNGLE